MVDARGYSSMAVKGKGDVRGMSTAELGAMMREIVARRAKGESLTVEEQEQVRRASEELRRRLAN